MQLGDHFPLKSQILKRTGVPSSQKQTISQKLPSQPASVHGWVAGYWQTAVCHYGLADWLAGQLLADGWLLAGCRPVLLRI